MNLEEKEHEWKQLSEANRFEDPLDFSIRFIMIRGATIYVLINMTLVIWLVQTMLSSDLQKLPRSLFFFAPILTAEPINDIKLLFENQSPDHTQQHLHTLNFINKTYNRNYQIQYNRNHGEKSIICPQGYEKESLKILPPIAQANQFLKNLTVWSEDSDKFQFCVRRMSKNSSFLSVEQCLNESAPVDQSQDSQIIQSGIRYYCSGYCVTNLQQCPITSIQKFSFPLDQQSPYAQMMIQDNLLQKPISTIEPGQLISQQIMFYPSNRQYNRSNSVLTFTRSPKKGKPIVQLKAIYDSFCANDFKQFEDFKTTAQYWSSIQDCSKQGKLSNGIIHIFDHIPTKTFFSINHVQNLDDILNINFAQDEKVQSSQSQNGKEISQEKPKISQEVNLVFIREVTFNKKVPGCEQLARDIRDQANQQKFSINSISPTFVQTILVSCFIFFVGCWFWLIGYYCCDGHAKQKNTVVILMAIIQLIVISYIFYTNKASFRAGMNWNNVASCIGEQVKTAEEWDFGVESQRPFLGLIFTSIVFLSIQLIAVIVDKIMYVSE